MIFGVIQRGKGKLTQQGLPRQEYLAKPPDSKTNPTLQ
jgi:hypothetical protein